MYSLLPNSTIGTVIVTSVCIALLYTIVLVIQRLKISPIAKFLGPRLAAATYWYEFYSDVILRGQFEYHMVELHKQYGPIIRINPVELHILDSDFYDTLYNNGQLAGRKTRVNKHAPWARQFGTPNSMFGTAVHDVHRRRRAAIAPMLSKRAVADLEPLIQRKIDLLMQRLKECKGGRPVSLFDLYSALTGDVISDYCFGQPLNLLDRPDFGAGWHRLIHEFGEMGHLCRQFGWLQPLLQSMPDNVAVVMNPPIAEIARMDRLSRKQIAIIKDQIGAEEKGETLVGEEEYRRTIFYNALTSELPEEEKQPQRFEAEANTLMIAGTGTSADMLGRTTFLLLNDPERLQKLRSELQSINGLSLGEKGVLQQLEQLPYLTAVIKEGMRLSWGVMQRLPRVFPDTELQYRNWVIPRNTAVSQSQWQVLTDAHIFPDPYIFNPERWQTASETERQRLERYFIPFSKGTRQCVGLNLAWAEMYMTVASVFGSNDLHMTVFETTEEDLRIVRDKFIPGFPDNSQGVRVIVE